MKHTLLPKGIVYVLCFFGLIAFACNQVDRTPKKEIEVRGIYGHPQPLWKQGHRLDSLGVNAIFVHGQSITKSMIDRARSEGAKVYAEFATLNGKNYVEDHPEAWAINEQGNRVEAASWFMGVCPTDPGFRIHRLDQLEKLLSAFELDGIWMDYVHWHAQFEEPQPILPETCFCQHCMATFASYADIELPTGEIHEIAKSILEQHATTWREWRCQIIIDWVMAFREVIADSRPAALLGLYHCPWTDTEYDGAQRRILGLDYALLKDYIDVFSPMVYHGRMEREPAWVAENISWLSQRLDIRIGSFPKLWPIVQADNSPHPISAIEFETVMRNGLTGAATGVMMFTTRSIAEDDEKLSVLRKIYAGEEIVRP